jgi:hypothetical protein
MSHHADSIITMEKWHLAADLRVLPIRCGAFSMKDPRHRRGSFNDKEAKNYLACLSACTQPAR